MQRRCLIMAMGGGGGLGMQIIYDIILCHGQKKEKKRGGHGK